MGGGGRGSETGVRVSGANGMGTFAGANGSVGTCGTSGGGSCDCIVVSFWVPFAWKGVWNMASWECLRVLFGGSALVPPAADPGRLEPAMVLYTGSALSVLVACRRTLMRYY